VVEALGQVSVMSDAPDLRVVLELLLQLLAVVGGLPLSGGQLRDTKEDELDRAEEEKMAKTRRRTRQSQEK